MDAEEEKNIALNPQDWYQDKVGAVTWQRNLLLGFCFALLILLGGGVFTVFKLSNSKKVEPFIIEIAKDSGRVTLVDPVTVKQYSANRAVAEYFLFRYLKAREAFNPSLFKYNYYTEVRLMSSQQVYDLFKSWIRLSNQDSPMNLYKDVISSDVKIRSLHYLNENTVQIRFAINFKWKDRVLNKNKVAIISYEYIDLEMNEEQRWENPLGFVITSYKVEDEFI